MSGNFRQGVLRLPSCIQIGAVMHAGTRRIRVHTDTAAIDTIFVTSF